MTSRPGAWLGAALVLAFALTSTGASAQTKRDFPTSKGNAQGTGRNGDPVAYGSGDTNLRWFVPFNTLAVSPLVIDNTDLLDTRFLSAGYGGPYPPNLSGFAASSPATKSVPGPLPSAGWTLVKEADEASSPYTLPRRSTPIGTLPIDNNPRFPAYTMTSTTPSLAGSSDPTQATDSADLRYFEWQFFAPAAGIQNYALYVWLPYGPTKVNGTPVYTQRYFVYEISYGAGQKAVDVVDTSTSGFGWVRLGNGGATSNVVFPWDPNNGIKIRLYNTIPRDANGNLTTGTTASAKNYLVYADAAMAIPASGVYVANPTSAGYVLPDDGTRLPDNALVSVTGALNTYERGTRNGSDYSIGKGVVTNYHYAYPNPLWRYSPLETSEYSTMIDNPAASSAGAWVTTTTGNTFQGANFLQAPIVNDANGVVSKVTYTPTLDEGSYEVYAYIPGDKAPNLYGTAVQAWVYEGTSVTVVPLAENAGGGWVRIGTRRFLHQPGASGNGPLKVVLTNLSTVQVNNAYVDAGKLAYADAVRFIGSSSLTINSTPVHATAKIRLTKGGGLTDTNVVIVADERGVIHCLDYQGKGDGTTTEYWSYPSTKDASDPNWTDPNQVATKDGVGPIAKMPTRFDLSTAVVKTISGKSYLWIASTNGRVYCINMEGDGDFSAAGRVGTTTRQWSFPDDFPSAAKTYNLGTFRGSLVYGDTTNGAAQPTVYVPAPEGRLYALDAVGDETKKTTTVLWAYPTEKETQLGSIQMTPSLEFGNVYFGTMKSTTSSLGGAFYAVNAKTGLLAWDKPFTTGSQAEVTEDMDDFICGPATVPGTELDNTRLGYVVPNDNLTSNPDMLYIVNQNRYVYGLNAHTGLLVDSASTGHLYRTNELSVGSSGNITYTTLVAYSRLGVPSLFPVILIPTEDGRMVGLFARSGDWNLYTTTTATYRRAFQLSTTNGANLTSATASNNWLFMGDTSGFLYGFNTDDGLLTSGGGYVPIGSDVIENNPAGAIFRNAQVKLINKATFTQLKQSNPNNLDYATATGSSSDPVRKTVNGVMAFDYGETVYVLVYNYPFKTTDTRGNTVGAPGVNMTISVEGKTSRVVPAIGQQFKSPIANQDGYAIFSFPLLDGGPNSLPPGNADVSVAISTASLNNQQVIQQIALDPTKSHKTFLVANPLGVAMRPSTDPTHPTLGDWNYQVGAGNNGSRDSSSDPFDPQNLINGGKNSGGIPFEAQLFIEGGLANHGNTQTQNFWLYDRSLLTLQKGPDRGLENVQLSRTSLRWQGGTNTLVKSLPSFYAGFEDYPDTYPNRSLDYPDIAEENIKFTKDPFGSAENPILKGVSLIPPTNVDETTGARTVRPTPVQATIEVPKYQPPVNYAALPGYNPKGQVTTPDDLTNWLTARHDSAGWSPYQGYVGFVTAFLPNGNGARGVTSRRFEIGLGVTPDERIVTTTPNLDLGILPQGAGYTVPENLGANGFNPWNGSADKKGMFQPFQVVNDGNVNLLNLRVALTDRRNGYAWLFGTSTNDIQTTLDASLNLASDMNYPFAPTLNGSNNVILQKPRVGEATPQQLTVNPIRRTNSNLGISNTINGQPNVYNPNYPAEDPKIAVTVPIGFPVGSYISYLRVIEDSTANYGLDAGESYSQDSGLPTTFAVRETRLTNKSTPKADTMIDSLLPAVLTNKNTYWNIEPSAYRDVFGNLVVAWASDRGAYSPLLPQPPSAADPTSNQNARNPYRIYVSSVANTTNFTQNGYETTQSKNANATQPLRDLNEFTSAKNSWFAQQSDAFPTTPLDTLFGCKIGESIIAGTERFGNPSFPQAGDRNPFNRDGNHEGSGAKLTGSVMAFTGEAQKQTPAGRVRESRLFLSTVKTKAGGAVSLGDPISIGSDFTSQKGKPSVVLTDQGLTIYYAATAAGQSSLYYAQVGSLGTVVKPLYLSAGFQWVTSPSAAARLYTGAPKLDQNGAPVTQIVDLSFVGKLEGVDKPQVYMGRLVVNPDGSPVANGTGSPWIFLPQSTNEKLLSEGNGVYRARGIEWDPTAKVWSAGARQLPVRLQLFLGSNAPVDLIVPGTVQISRETGIISADCPLGGQVFLNPTVGTVHFSGAAPSKSAELRLSYVPGYLRITEGTGPAYNAVSGLYDDHYVSDYTYWFRANGALANASDALTDDRYVFIAGRDAGGNASTARPSMSSMRFGVRIPYKIATDNNGGVQVAVSWPGGKSFPYQVDPTGNNGRIYFPAAAEGLTVNIKATVQIPGTKNVFTYDTSTDIDPSTGLQNSPGVSLILEAAENNVPIDQPFNETNVTAFVDPFSFVSSVNTHRERPLLMWLFYSSTRSGGPDVYMQTLTPRFMPYSVGQ